MHMGITNELAKFQYISQMKTMKVIFNLKILSKLTYALVVEVKEITSVLFAPHGNVCESWGVMQE
jgi:hypothetical protein